MVESSSFIGTSVVLMPGPLCSVLATLPSEENCVVFACCIEKVLKSKFRIENNLKNFNNFFKLRL